MPSVARSVPHSTSAHPWYREPWPWMLMAGPATVVVASIATLILALRTENALVVDNYYKEGLAINQVLDAKRNAAAHHLRAKVAWVGEDRIGIGMSGDETLPERLRLQLVHPTRASLDRNLVLERYGVGLYRAAQEQRARERLSTDSARWYVQLEDEKGTWRLSGLWDLRRSADIALSSAGR